MENKTFFKLFVKAKDFDEVREVLQEDEKHLSIDIIQKQKDDEYKVTGHCSSEMLHKLLGLNDVDMIAHRPAYLSKHRKHATSSLMNMI